MQKDPFPGVRWVWRNGELIEFERATVHLLSHVIHYGSGWFEGIRCYETASGPAVFRLREHMKRLYNSCKIYHAEMPYSVDQMMEATLETIRANGFRACYIRPIVYRGYGPLGVNPLNSPIEVDIAVWPWGKYLGDEAQQLGVDVCVSSWRRPDPGSLPANAKSCGAYVTSQLIKVEAIKAGFVEGIALDAAGHVSEGSGENLFLVNNGELFTTPLAASILPGITRESVLQLARDLGIPAYREEIPRGLLYTCDELFFTGTAAEVTPIRSVDRVLVGDGRPGPITQRLMEEFMGIVEGRIEDRHGWLTPVGEVAQQSEAPAAAQAS